VKEEGLPFIIAMTIAYLTHQIGCRRAASGADTLERVGVFVAGIVPGCLLLACIKASAPARGLTRAIMDFASLTQLTDASRHALIGDALLSTLLGWAGIRGYLGIGPFIVLIVLLGGWRPTSRYRTAAGFGIVALGGLACSYYVAYLISPYDLEWHLSTSLHRILVHLWPIIVWVLCLVIPFEGASPTVRAAPLSSRIGRVPLQ
jgi:hypothetical protein